MKNYRVVLRAYFFNGMESELYGHFKTPFVNRKIKQKILTIYKNEILNDPAVKKAGLEFKTIKLLKVYETKNLEIRPYSNEINLT